MSAPSQAVERLRVLARDLHYDSPDCRAVCETVVLATDHDAAVSALARRVEQLELMLTDAAFALERSYDATEWPANGESVQERTAKMIRSYFAGGTP